MAGPPASAPTTSSSSSLSAFGRRRFPHVHRRHRGSGDHHPPHQSEPPAAAASPPRRRRGGGGDHQPPPPHPPAAGAAAESASPRGRRRGGDREPPPPIPPAGEVAAAASVAAGEGDKEAGPRRSFRLRHRVRVVPWVKPPLARKPKGPAKPQLPSIEERVAEWAKGKAGSGATEEECVLPFLQKGAPKKVECLVCSKSISPGDKMRCSVRDCDEKLHKACSEKNDGCCPRHDKMFDSVDLTKKMISWSLWPSTCEDSDPADGIEEAFKRLPLPYTFQEFNIDTIKKEDLDNGTEPPPYTQYCGWGAKALEAIEKDDFVIEFVGEVIDDKTFEERLEDMRRRADKNFYMCKVKKDFVIDATFKGNDCRFFNHSCEPNCQLQKWQVNGRTRLGVFASKAIEVGEPLTYDYRFEQHYGPDIQCFCMAQNCQGKLSVTGKD
uniref:SET domain-containing protein n=1 Tax=Leersia perrieri TaxID=77586 RepID=A0A0D9X8C8_9ORYZ